MTAHTICYLASIGVVLAGIGYVEWLRPLITTYFAEHFQNIPSQSQNIQSKDND